MVLFGMFFLREHREPAAGKFDAAGFRAVGRRTGLAAVCTGKDRAALGFRYRADDPAFGIAALVALVFVELRHSRPMLPLRMLRDRLSRG